MATKEQLAEWIASLTDEDGLVKPEVVITEAKSPDCIAHSHFDWNDKSAGHKYRLIQARKLITELTAFDHGLNRQVPLYVSLKNDRAEPGGGYRKMSNVLKDEELRAELIKTVVDELDALRERSAMIHDIVDAPLTAAAEQIKAHAKPGKSKKKAKRELVTV